MKPKQLNIKMTHAEFEEICNGLNNGNVEEAIAAFISSYREQELSRDDVLSLTLNKAVIYGEPDIVEKILSTPHAESILTPIIGSYDSVIRKIFAHERTDEMVRKTDGSVFGAVLEYLKHNRDIPLVDLEGEDFASMYYMLKLPRWEVTLDDRWWYIRKYFLDSLYTKDSLDKLDRSLYTEFSRAEYLKEYGEQQKKGMLKLQNKVEEDDDDGPEGGGAGENNSGVDRGVQTIATNNSPSIRNQEASDGMSEEVVVYGSSRDCRVDRNDGGIDVIAEVLNNLLGWIEELPVWLQEHVMERHSVERALEYVKSCSNGLLFKLFEEGVDGTGKNDESTVMDTWELVRADYVASHGPDVETVNGYAIPNQILGGMSGMVNVLCGDSIGIEEVYDTVGYEDMSI
ncbi:hypothetical protein EDM53_03985 [Rickettsiales endosymbiont of Peranema trichophorum]|uniref:hypothetical protein n=1 Tax=Rickettsiales endosymbiont of Peranema trichophorum TaxID=2486577 RepID=UPI001022BDD1|nr:hypothetical protein [Rickettsiales endosymbiont of Peranema trichophorum]RZI46354.1 hypothetical protein EDM53_03985 [Rickettsiales endosymbiont of Peranema trichophorum]